MNYERLINEEREIYINGEKADCQMYFDKLTIGESNLLNKVIDSFEDGGNAIKTIDNVTYEFYQYGMFEIRRKCQNVI